MSSDLRIAIVGAGIGGTALATALMQRGFTVRIFERASAFGEIGAGVQMTPNAVKVIRALGLYDGLLKVGFPPENIIGRNWKSGRDSFRIPLTGEYRQIYGAPYIHVHRADLHNLFASQIPVECAEFGKVTTRVEQTERGGIVHFADGTSYEADLIVGADGVRSAVRSSIIGDAEPRYTGHMCFRALVQTNGVVPFVGPNNTMWMGANGHVVTYYVKNGQAVNLVAVAQSPEWVEEGWNVPATKAELLAHYPNWHPDVLKLFDKVDTVYRWGLFDRDPISSWSRGNITLLGDAAHPMLPFLSQGAAMAIEDAYVLAAALDMHRGDVRAALSAYEAERIPRTSRVQLESRKRGQTYHLPSGWAQARRDFEYWLRSIFAPQTTGIRADWVYEYDATDFAPPAVAQKLAS